MPLPFLETPGPLSNHLVPSSDALLLLCPPSRYQTLMTMVATVHPFTRRHAKRPGSACGLSFEYLPVCRLRRPDVEGLALKAGQEGAAFPLALISPHAHDTVMKGAVYSRTACTCASHTNTTALLSLSLSSANARSFNSSSIPSCSRPAPCQLLRLEQRTRHVEPLSSGGPHSNRETVVGKCT